MPRVLSDMDRAWRADQEREHEFRDMARKLKRLAARADIAGTALAKDCEKLAREFTKRADHIVAVWE